MPSKPKSSEDVYNEMNSYCKTKQFSYSDSEIRFMAEDCFLCFEGRGWNGVKYWPAIAKRWVLNNRRKPKTSSTWPVQGTQKESKGKTMRQKILEQEN